MSITFYMPSTFTPVTAYSANAMPNDQSLWGSDCTWRMTYPSSVLSATGDNVRVELDRFATDYTVGEMWIGIRAGSGDAFDYASTPTQILFSGGSSVVVDETKWSDWLVFPIAADTDYIIGFWVSSASPPAAVPGNWAGNGVLHAVKYEVNESASPLDTGGMTGTGVRDVCIKTIEVA